MVIQIYFYVVIQYKNIKKITMYNSLLIIEQSFIAQYFCEEDFL